MRRLTFIVILIALSACGQKGDLYFPDDGGQKSSSQAGHFPVGE